MFFRGDGDEEEQIEMSVDQLLELSESEHRDDRIEAAEKMGKLDKQYDSVIDRLRYLAEDDPKKKVRRAASNSLNQLDAKPVDEAVIQKDAGQENTGFDDEIGDSSLEEGEYDFESSMEDEEEDQIEADVEGQGLNVIIQEDNNLTLDFDGDKTDQSPSNGRVIVQNTGHTNRITGIDLLLHNMDQIETEEEIDGDTHIGVLAPGRENDWSFDYTFDKEVDPISVVQSYQDPETGLSPNFLGGESKQFVGTIILTNTLDETIYNIEGTKTINEFATLQNSDITIGEVNSEDNQVTFTIEELNPEESTEITLELEAALPDDVSTYEAGELSINYDTKSELLSGLEFGDIDGVSDFKYRVRRKQRETNPAFYDCEIVLKNVSEDFTYDLNRFTVFAGDIDSQQTVLDWEGEEATEDEREIVPGEEVVFEFVFESHGEVPTFAENIDFSVQYQKEISSTTNLTLPAKDLRFMAISVSKVFLDEDDNEVTEYELPSYIETEVPTMVTLTGVGTYPLEGLIIRDELPEHFRSPRLDEVIVTRNGSQLEEGHYDVQMGETEDAEDALVVDISHLEETEQGGLEKDDQINVKYTAIAENPEPREEPIMVQSHAEGFVYDDPESRVFADSELEGLNLIVVHKRANVDIGKSIFARDYEGQDAYKIELDGENYGTSTERIKIRDLIPEGFELISDTISSEPEGIYEEPNSVKDGLVHGWTFDTVEPGQSIKATYIVVESTPESDPRDLQKIYQG